MAGARSPMAHPAPRELAPLVPRFDPARTLRPPRGLIDPGVAPSLTRAGIDGPKGRNAVKTPAAAVVAATLLAVPLIAAAQGWRPPPESQRCPSKWGAGDERGSGNHMKNPATVLRAVRLI